MKTNTENRYLLENLDWLHESLGDYDDDYLIIDCPGQSIQLLHSACLNHAAAQLDRPDRTLHPFPDNDAAGGPTHKTTRYPIMRNLPTRIPIHGR